MPDSANITTGVIITAVVIFAESSIITVLIAVCVFLTTLCRYGVMSLV